MMAGMNEGLVFYTRARRYGTIEVIFESEEMARKYSNQTRKTEKWLMFPIYMGRRFARVSIGVIILEVKPEGVVAALLKGVQMESEVISASRTKVVNS